MAEDIFTQLRRLVHVTEEVKTLQKTVLNKKTDEDFNDGSAVLLLRDLQKDIQKLKMETRRQLYTVSNDDGFMDLVPLCQKLLQHKLDTFETLETHMVSYGYTPIENTLQKGDDKENQGPAEGSSGSLTPGDTNNGVLGESTPLSKAKAEKDEELDRTPTLEDFGLSESHLASILKRDKGVFKEPPAPLMESNVNRAQMSNDYRFPSSMKKWSSSESIPDAFKNAAGIAITPGLFGERSVSAITPGEHLGDLNLGKDVFVTPSAPTPKQKLLSSLASDEGDYFNSPQAARPVFNLDAGNGYENSPQPPVFTTPGLKHLHRPKSTLNHQASIANITTGVASEENSPAYPVFNTPGLNKICKPLHKPLHLTNKNNEDSSTENSPAFPVFNTPGLTRTIPALNKLSKENYSQEDDNSTPDPPDFMTPDLRGRLPSKLTHTISTSSQHSSLGSTPQLTYNISREVLKVHQRNATTVPDAPRLAFKSETEDELPDTPELTYKFNSTLPVFHKESLLAKPTSVGQTSFQPDGPILPNITSGSHHFMDEDDLPPEPELTCNLSKQLWNKVSLQPVNETPGSVVANCDLKEDLASPDLDVIRPITSEEYIAQPSWVQRQLSLQMLEDSVKIINAMLVQKIKDGKALTLNEKDVGSVGMSFVLVNTKRILLHRATSVGTTYSVIHKP